MSAATQLQEAHRLDGRGCDSCGGAQTELRKKIASNGAEMFAYQCTTCGRSASSWIKRSAIAAPDNVGAWDHELQSRYDDYNRALWLDERTQVQRQRRLFYQQHLLSPKWRSIRARVLQRARGQCEGCGQAEAREVHHLTYDHLGDELLFELVALCGPCHEKAHDLRRLD